NNFWCMPVEGIKLFSDINIAEYGIGERQISLNLSQFVLYNEFDINTFLNYTNTQTHTHAHIHEYS
ncbi:hypothetical protein ACQP3D_27640, partial [Escherichia coli]